jgi:hypothetical protein
MATRRFERTFYNRDTGKIEHMHDYTIAIYPGNNDIITITRDGKYKTVKVVECSEYCFKLQKTQIKAIGGATGLFKLIDEHLTEKFAECWAYQIMNHAIDVMKEAKI